MPKRSSKRSKAKPDAKEVAHAITADLSGNASKPEKPPEKVKNPAAVALGRLGGLKGGKARKEKLSPKRRAEIARAAAAARWGKGA